VNAEQRRRALWKLLEERGGRHGLPETSAEIIDLWKEADQRGLEPTLRDVLELLQSDRRRGVVVPPAVLVDFAAAYLSASEPRRLLDPWAGRGLLLQELTAKLPSVDQAVGVVVETGAMELAEAFGADERFDWRLGHPLQVVEQVDGTFEAVVSAPPLGLQPRRVTLPVDGRAVQLYDEDGRLAVLAAAQRLSADGEALFLVTDSFFFFQGRRTVWRHLEEFGLFPSAVIRLPERSLAPATPIAVSLVIVGRKSYPELFIGQVDPAADAGALVENLRRRSPGAVPELGRLVDASTFKGVGPFLDEDRVSTWARREGLQAVSLGSICSRIAFFDSAVGGFKEEENSVYLAPTGSPRTAAATSVGALRAKPESCFQLVLKPELAVAEYVAQLLNSDRGLALRRSWSVGGTIQRIQRQGLDQRTIFLPPLQQQAEVVHLDDTVRNLRSRLAQIGDELWESPSKLPEIRRGLESFIEEEGAWIENLPFPIASILWRYYSEVSARDRVEHLLHFFEALALFSTSVLVSGYYGNPDVFEQHRAAWFGNVKGLTRATFGTWTTAHARVAETVRSQLRADAERELLLDLFRTKRSTMLDSLSSEELVALFDVARTRRNDWTGHTGVAGDAEHQRRVAVLDSDLSHFREILGSAFRGYEVLRPMHSRYRNGVYLFTAQSLVGSRRDFRVIEVEATAPMDEDRIYLLDRDTPTPLEILPLFRIKPGPRTEEDACYFYNRLENGAQVRLVSYHFERESELNEPDPPVAEAISRLTGKA
jgi:hypothetical protein